MSFIKKSFSSIRTLVVGDVMLDRYWLGSVNRVSPEAPVPVVLVNSTELRVGGAGNVAANIRGLGASCDLVSIVGDDDGGKKVLEILETQGVECHMKIDKDCRTTEKLRILGRNQQLLRADFEALPNKATINSCVTHYKKLISKTDVVILSDYGKGVILDAKEMIQVAIKHKIPIVVDPKGSDFSKYTGATLITPNETELESVIGVWTSEHDLENQVKELIKKIEVQGLLLTRGEKGMTYFRREESAIHQDAISIEVYDVSGAGDTVVSSIAIGIVSGLTWEEMLFLANAAAGIVIKKLGTSVVTMSEVLSAIAPDNT
ncbi:MAG: D-glycero-beta-D-manno-heptose-7-phosphate kinase [Acidiferrobacteraceae bacterium]|nr:D-glycero-beta-D-manno-heptose-7-phosphate kinase [Acidiferrobacteraceae bacterium]|tara:strand:+ start:64529 stop:65482 length:954 start_codon:yes stop_codon:yes gene_type:complete